MRSIFIHFSNAGEQEILSALDGVAERMGPNHWQSSTASETEIWCCVTAEFDDWEPEAMVALRGAMPAPSKFIQADVTGTIPAQDVVSEFCEAILLAVPGAVVTDDHTSHPWTVHEMRAGAVVQGHPFFDTQGWYDDTAG